MWPAALGGPTSYVIVTGHSMEPTLYRGDFVVLRAGDYQVGDVVSYYPVDGLSAQVIHRIIDFNEDGTAVLQGDNNSFVDPYTPSTDRIAGKMVFAVPRIGNVAWVLGRPFVWGSLVLLAVALLLYPKKTATEVSGPADSAGSDSAELTGEAEASRDDCTQPGRADQGARGDQETHGNEAQGNEERGRASADADD